jgi:hypothetical protein
MGNNIITSVQSKNITRKWNRKSKKDKEGGRERRMDWKRRDKDKEGEERREG